MSPLPQFLDGLGNGLWRRHLELDPGLGDGTIVGPSIGAESSFCALTERPSVAVLEVLINRNTTYDSAIHPAFSTPSAAPAREGLSPSGRLAILTQHAAIKGEDPMSEFTYALAETVVRVSARSVSVTDPFKDDPGPHTTIEGLEVEVATVADNNDKVKVELMQGDRELSATLTPDGRLQSIEYNSVGVGTQVVTGIAKIVAFVGSLVIAAGGLAADSGDPVKKRDADAEWAEKYPAQETRLNDYKEVHAEAATQLHALRQDVIRAVDTTTLRSLTVRAAAVERVMEQAAAEVAQIMESKAAWIDGERTRVTCDLQTVVRFVQIAKRGATDTSAPVPPADGAAGELWRDFGLILEERRVTHQKVEPTLTEGKAVKPADPPSYRDGTEVLWRVPEETELWVWKRGATDDDDPVLVSREILWVSDHECEEEGFRLTTSVFGEHGGSLTFGEDGRPVSVRHKQQSTFGAVIEALAAVPDAVSGAVTTAKSTADNISSLRDLQAVRALADAERQVNLATKKLELAGIEATAKDYAALQEAEQAVKLHTARQAVAPASPDLLAALNRELETVATQNAIAAERRAAALDVDLADMRSEIARLELEVMRQRAEEQLEAPAEGR